ncbi:MAG: hypothetical protein ACI4OA_02930 [Selenomonadaceae bacterium]
MIYLTGDTHIPIDVGKLDSQEFREQKTLTRNDYVIVLGDFGLLWHEDKIYRHWLNWFRKRKFTTLWLDGNHENHEWIQEIPPARWHGGMVHYVADNIIHLGRGSIFNLEGKYFFVMGGAESHDRYLRREGSSWWPGEIPSQEEMERGIRNIEAHHKKGLKIDYVLTHTCPSEIIEMMFQMNDENDPVTKYLDIVNDMVKDEMTGWYFGHWHFDKDFWKYHCMYYNVMRLV